jgi:glucose-1-phosphate cytidylyltransferase
LKNNFRTAVILCGGKGTRLGVIGKKIPKTLVSVQKKKIIWYIINILQINNFNHFILPIGYRGNLIKKFINREFRKNDFLIDIVNTGTNSSISRRISKIKSLIKSDNFLLLNGDAIFDFNIDKLFNAHQKNNSSMTFISHSVKSNFGTIGFKQGKVYDFKRDTIYNAVKLKNIKDYIGYIYTGMSIINKKVIKKDFSYYNNFEKELYPWIIKNFKCSIAHLDGFWHAIDNVKDIDIVNKNKNYMFFQVKKILNKVNSFYDKS